MKQILITGGAASGKSACAEKLLCSLTQDRLYLATMDRQSGSEANERIRRHQSLRNGKNFALWEQSFDLSSICLPRKYGGILLEDLGNLLANELFLCKKTPEQAERSILDGLKNLRRQCDFLIVVTNTVFSDGVCYLDETEQYRRLLGRLNQAIAQASHIYAEVVCGIWVPVKGEIEL